MGGSRLETDRVLRRLFGQCLVGLLLHSEDARTVLGRVGFQGFRNFLDGCSFRCLRSRRSGLACGGRFRRDATAFDGDGDESRQ